MVSGKTRVGPPYARRSSPRSTRTGTAPGRWTGNAITASSPTSPTPNPTGVLPDIAPGVLMDGDDIGRWLKRQKQPGTWKLLSTEQQERLTVLGIKPLEAQSPPRQGRPRHGPAVRR